MVGVERLGCLQNALVLDRIANGDISNMPALETMFELDKDNNDKITAIGTHLEECCDEIKSLLKELKILINNKFNKLSKMINQGFEYITRLIQESFRDVFDFYKKEKASYQRTVLKWKQDVLKEIREIIKDELIPIKESITSLENSLNEKCVKINGNIHRVSTQVSTAQKSIEAIIADISVIEGEVITILPAIGVSTTTVIGSLSGVIGVQTTELNAVGKARASSIKKNIERAKHK